MIRSVKSLAAVLVAAAAVAVLPGTAVAAAQHRDGPLVVFGDGNQFAGGDVFNAGGDNNVGSFDGDPTAGLPGVGLPGVNAGIVRIVTDSSVPYPGLTRVSQQGSGDYPERLFPNVIATVPIDGPSEVVYASSGGAGQVKIAATVTAGVADATCTSSGNLRCRIDYADPNRPVLISGAF
ncbi:hypothetical protein [Streptacidiphilus anmyonensis]|uniref:hypothetical protein n=1 Tax=Streptacidiphilus anmyonensis TaxID=405782 RepID=UPI0005A71C91|nr:hypothetical protein [Streptacidiphilus anmyonensis]